ADLLEAFNDQRASALLGRADRMQAGLDSLLPFFAGSSNGINGLAGALDPVTLDVSDELAWAALTLRWPRDLVLHDRSSIALFQTTSRAIWERSFHHLPIGLGWHDDAVWPYNALDWAQAALRDDRPDQALRILESVLNASWYTGSWAEEYHVAPIAPSVGSAAGGYDVPNTNMHVTAPAGAILLMRNLLVEDDSSAGALEIASGLPTGWFRPTGE